MHNKSNHEQSDGRHLLRTYLKQCVRSKGLSRIGALLLALMLALFLVSCSVVEDEPYATEKEVKTNLIIKAEDDRTLREDEWVRMLTLAVSNLEGRSSLWSSIPAAQRDEISLSDFILYTDFLSASIPNTVVSFSRATSDEAEDILGHVNKTDATLIPSSQQVSIWWIESETPDSRVLRFAIPITLNDKGAPYFSKSWLQKQSMLYHYIVLYLDAVERRNEPALKSLIQQNAPIKSKCHGESIDKRASSLIELYPKHVASRETSYRVVKMVPGFAEVELQGIPENKRIQRSRTITFSESDGLITANERFPQTLSSDDAILYYRGRPLFGSERTSPRIEAERMISLLGIPLNIEILDDTDSDASLFRVVWPGLTVEAVGTCHIASLSFSGNVRQVSATYSQFKTGSDLQPGDSIYELYKRYPFIREQGYVISRGEVIKKTLSVQVETDYITRLTITIES